MIKILHNTVTFLKRVSLKDNIKHNEINIILYIYININVLQLHNTVTLWVVFPDGLYYNS